MIDAELDLLGAAMLDGRITTTIRLTSREFASPAAGAAWEAIRELVANGTTPDPVLVSKTAAPIRVEPNMIVELIGRGIPVNAEAYAEIITAEYRKRTFENALRGALHGLSEGHELAEVSARLEHFLAVPEEAEDVVASTRTLDEFADEQDKPMDWVVPPLLARGERLVLTGSEGLGKSIWARQVAACAAAGLQPFTFQRVPPVKVLMVDCENPEHILRRKMRWIRDMIRSRGCETADRFWLKCFPGGLDVSTTEGRLKLTALCRVISPDLLYIGPAYKLHTGGGGVREEDLARQVTSVLDELRERHNFALILEHHSPHEAPGQKRTARPVGSSLWRRWPEFGYGLVRADGYDRDHRVADWVAWRGARDERPWPQQLEQGGALPWIDTNPNPDGWMNYDESRTA